MIALDTGILIWGVRGFVQPGREDLIERCRWLIQDHRDRRIPLMVPSIALAEYLADFDEQSQDEQRKLIGANYFVAPFDNEAAWETARLFDRERVRAIRQNGTPKQWIHSDLKIIATAIAHGATHLYTDNVKDFQSLANDRIQIKPVPALPQRESQRSLLSDDD